MGFLIIPLCVSKKGPATKKHILIEMRPHKIYNWIFREFDFIGKQYVFIRTCLKIILTSFNKHVKIQNIRCLDSLSTRGYICSDGSRSKNFELGRVGSIFWCSGPVGSGQPSLVWVWIWQISPKNHIFFNFFPFGYKKSLQIRSKSTWGQRWVCGSKVCSG